MMMKGEEKDSRKREREGEGKNATKFCFSAQTRRDEQANTHTLIVSQLDRISSVRMYELIYSVYRMSSFDFDFEISLFKFFV